VSERLRDEWRRDGGFLVSGNAADAPAPESLPPVPLSAERRCQEPGCDEQPYVSPAGYRKSRCARHRAAQRRPEGSSARNPAYWHLDALEGR